MIPQGGDNAALIDLVSLQTTQDQVADGGFETPVLAAKTSVPEPSGTPWQYTGLAGITTNGARVELRQRQRPQGAQAGYLMNNASMSYSVCLDADTYSLSFQAAQRAARTRTRTSRLRSWSTARRSPTSRPPVRHTVLTRRRTSRSLPECTPSSSWAWPP